MELVISVAVISVLFSVVYLFMRPAEYKAKARDNKRMSDLANFERMINEFYIDNGYYPDIQVDDLSMYNVKIPQDPINDATYFYTYQTDGAVYEINARLEYLTEEMEDDGGNQSEFYEVGNNLYLLP
ncbi:hypothetical protein JXA34_02925 [Patescibacteria group bacterium]|nr:hypothetical protein [Patescibacteria group bacterium]